MDAHSFLPRMVTLSIKRVPTLFLKAVLVAIAVAVVAFAALLLPHVWPGSINPEYATYVNAAYPGVAAI